MRKQWGGNEDIIGGEIDRFKACLRSPEQILRGGIILVKSMSSVRAQD